MAARSYFPVLVLVAASAFFAFDIATDLGKADESLLHVAVEGLVFLLTAGALLLEIRRVLRLREALAEDRARLERLSGELFAVMQRSFEQWGLSPSESEVALLLLKGLTMREIADLRQVREKTIRQQAASIYAKSGQSGRHELAAHFIGDLIGAGPPQAH